MPWWVMPQTDHLQTNFNRRIYKSIVRLSQMMIKAKEKSEVELVLLKMHSQRDINF